MPDLDRERLELRPDDGPQSPWERQRAAEPGRSGMVLVWALAALIVIGAAWFLLGGPKP